MEVGETKNNYTFCCFLKCKSVR